MVSMIGSGPATDTACYGSHELTRGSVMSARFKPASLIADEFYQFELWRYCQNNFVHHNKNQLHNAYFSHVSPCHLPNLSLAPDSCDPDDIDTCNSSVTNVSYLFVLLTCLTILFTADLIDPSSSSLQNTIIFHVPISSALIFVHHFTADLNSAFLPCSTLAKIIIIHTPSTGSLTHILQSRIR